MKLLHLALRNLGRNLRRSLITLAAITVGLAALIFIWGFIDGINEQMIENSTRYVSGHIKVHRQGFHAAKELTLALKDDDAVRSQLTNTSGVEAVTPRVEGKALLSGAEKSRAVFVAGVDPAQETKVTTIDRAIVAGRYLMPSDGQAIVLGDKTAKALGLVPGDEAVLITQASDGSLGAGRYRVVGIFDTGIDVLDAGHVFLPIDAARDLFSLWGQITAWVIRMSDRGHAADVAQQLETTLGPGYEVLDWPKLLPSMVQMVHFHETVTYIVVIIMFAVVGMGIANTILMAVMERTREFGVLMALGTSRAQIFGLVLAESLLLALGGLVAGNALGLGITSVLGHTGLDLGQYSQAMETMPGLSGVVYPLIRFDHVMLVSLAVLAVSIVPALYPAWRASRVAPVQAIRGSGEKAVALDWLRPGGKVRASSRAVFWKIALRGIFRNPRRSLITAGATALGLAAFLFLYAFADGFFEQMIRNSTGFLTADLQVERKGFRDELASGLSIEQPDGLLQLAAAQPQTRAASPRIEVHAMASSPVGAEPLLLLGVDPALERQVTQLQDVLVEGEYLSSGKQRGIMVGRKLAQKLGLRLGEKMVVNAQQADGSLGSAAYRVVGIFVTGNDVFDESLGFVPLPAAQSLMGMGDAVSAVAIRLKDRGDLSTVVAQLRSTLAATSYEIKTWEELMPVVVQMINLTKLNFDVVIMVVFIVVAMGIMNTLLMSVLERTREFGVMMALGTEPGQIRRLVMYESLVLGALGILAGAGLGTALVAYYGTSGMNLGGFAGATGTIPGVTETIYPLLRPKSVWVPTLALFLIGLAASLYPATRAARLVPVAAIRHA